MHSLGRVVADNHLELGLEENEADGFVAKSVVQWDGHEVVGLASCGDHAPFWSISGEYAHECLRGRLQTQMNKGTADLLGDFANL